MVDVEWQGGGGQATTSLYTNHHHHGRQQARQHQVLAQSSFIENDDTAVYEFMRRAVDELSTGSDSDYSK